MEQLYILALVFLGIIGGGYAVRHMASRKRAEAIETLRLDPDESGKLRILSFYGPTCEACDRQKSVLNDLERERPDSFSVELRDASVDYDYARQFGLMVVPTTVVIAANGAIAAINSGFTSRSTLEEQLDAA